jgi:plastocyanin
MLLMGAVLLVAAVPASAATVAVEATEGFAFDPDPVSVNLGDTVKWHAQSFNHTATSDTGFFSLALNPGTTKSHVFRYAGAFPYYCRFHGSPGSGMHGEVTLPDRWLNTGTQHAGDVQRIRISTAKAPEGLAFDVQMRATGDEAWTTFKRRNHNAVMKFTSDAAGQYQFRSRVHRLSNDKVSRWSPATLVEIAG